MRKLFTSGMFIFAGVVSLPVGLSHRQTAMHAAPEYRTDPRLATLSSFFRKSACPAEKYSAAFLEAADQYELDWRLLPSISFIESTGGKAAPHNNMFGWDSGRAHFPTATAGIHAVGYRLAHSSLYRDKELDELLATYNPNAEYAQKVKSVMRRISPSE